MNMLKKLLKILAKIHIKLPLTGGALDYLGTGESLPPPLPKAEEAEAIRRLAEGDEEAKTLLIEHNLRLVVYIAKRFENTGAGLEDLISIGAIGLIKAVNTFSADRAILTSYFNGTKEERP